MSKKKSTNPAVIAWQNSIRQIEEEIRHHKNITKQEHGFDAPQSQRSLVALGHMATVLYALRAHYRSNVHHEGSTLHDQEQFLIANKQLWEHIVVLQQKQAA